MSAASRSRSMPELRGRLDHQNLGIAFMRGGSRVPATGKWDMRALNASVPSSLGTPQTDNSFSRSRTSRGRPSPGFSPLPSSPRVRRSRSASTKSLLVKGPAGSKPLSPAPFPYTIGKRREQEGRERAGREMSKGQYSPSSVATVARFRSHSVRNDSKESYWSVVLPRQQEGRYRESDIPPPPPVGIAPPLTPLSTRRTYSVCSFDSLSAFESVKEAIRKLNNQNNITSADLGSKALTFTLSSQSGIIASKLLDPDVVNDPELLIPMLKCAKMMLINVADHIDTLLGTES